MGGEAGETGSAKGGPRTSGKKDRRETLIGQRSNVQSKGSKSALICRNSRREKGGNLSGGKGGNRPVEVLRKCHRRGK